LKTEGKEINLLIKMMSGFNNYSMLDSCIALSSLFGAILGHIFQYSYFQARIPVKILTFNEV
jgi:hypothetical protein